MKPRFSSQNMFSNFFLASGQEIEKRTQTLKGAHFVRAVVGAVFAAKSAPVVHLYLSACFYHVVDLLRLARVHLQEEK